MKIRYLLLILPVLTTGFASCKKDNNQGIVGNWQETKLRMYMQDNNGTTLYDTIYLQPFTNLDYIRFNSNGTCVIGADHYYYLNEKVSLRLRN